MNKRLTPSRAVVRQAGFTLIEMMVALSLGMVILLGMTVTFVNLKNTFQSQDKLGQLQDNERFALSMLTTSLNEAGYYPDPRSASPLKGNTPSATPGGTTVDKNYIYGTADGGTATTPESISTTYATSSGDGIMSCLGTTTSAAAGTTVSMRNIFYVDSTKNSLMCKVVVGDGSSTTDSLAHSGTAEELIGGVRSMTVLYGIAPTGTQITTYKTAANVTAAEWVGSVKAVRVSLVFINPFTLADMPARTHTINLMN